MAMYQLIAALVVLSLAAGAMGFESTKVPPQGVRVLSLKSVSTTIHEKSDSNGQAAPLGDALAKPLTFHKVLATEANLIRKNQIQAFLAQEGLSDQEHLGEFSSDLAAKVDVYAPLFSYGLSQRTAIAVVLPIYHMATNVTLGFQPNQQLMQKVLLTLTDDMRQHGAAMDIQNKINNVIPEFNSKLGLSGYKPLGAWRSTALGDAIIALKHLAYTEGRQSFAAVSGLVLPTDKKMILTTLRTYLLGMVRQMYFFRSSQIRI